MTQEFDRARLIAALAAGDIHADDETIDSVDAWLFTLWFQYRMRKKNFQVGRAKASKELQKINQALLEWYSCEEFKWEVYLLSRFDHLKIAAMEWFGCTVGEAIDRLEFERKRHGRENPKTTLFVQLYNGYVDLSGRTGLTDEGDGHGPGPGVRFITECAALIDVSVPDKLRQLIQTSIAREEKRNEAACKNPEGNEGELLQVQK